MYIVNFEQWLALKMRVRYGVSIVLLFTFSCKVFSGYDSNKRNIIPRSGMYLKQSFPRKVSLGLTCPCSIFRQEIMFYVVHNLVRLSLQISCQLDSRLLRTHLSDCRLVERGHEFLEIKNQGNFHFNLKPHQKFAAKKDF